MAKQKIEVQGIHISIENDEYVSLTDIAKQGGQTKPVYLIQNWMKNSSTIIYLYEWERLHNLNIKANHLDGLLRDVADNRVILSPAKFIKQVNAVGMYQKTGRGGGTYAHRDIALNFCFYLNPVFQIYLIKEFQRLKDEEADRKGLEWTIDKLLQSNQDTAILLQSLQTRLDKG